MKKYDVAAFVWPSYTGDELRSRIFWPEGYGEWQTVHNVKKNSVGKPANYKWDRRPLWGYVNEANPDVCEMQINCAVRHGVNVFIYDWYWYDGREFLSNCLDDGFLKAKNNDLMKFYIMWANHTVNNIWNIELSSTLPSVPIWDGAVDMDGFKKLVKLWIEKYFSHPSYYKIDGKPVFMLYEPNNFIRSFGGAEGARAAVEYFRSKVAEAGYPGLHFQLVSRGSLTEIQGENGEKIDVYRALGCDSCSEYQVIGLARAKHKEEFFDYECFIDTEREHYQDMAAQKDVVYFPHVSLGWDNNPRFRTFNPPVVENATPDKVERFFRMAKEYVDTHELPVPLVTVNSWNEWTETSYLEPDTLYGYGYLEALKRVFVDED